MMFTHDGLQKNSVENAFGFADVTSYWWSVHIPIYECIYVRPAEFNIQVANTIVHVFL